MNSRELTSDIQSWHGFPRQSTRITAQSACDALRRLGDRQGGAEGLEDRSITDWFNPLATGARLRKEIDQLSDFPVSSDRELAAGADLALHEPFIFRIDSKRYLLAPEGLELRDLLATALAELRDSDRVHLSWDATDQADQRLLAFYRTQTLRRLSSVALLRSGGGKPLLPAAVAPVLLLLLNGNIGTSNGLVRPQSEAELAEVDGAIAAVSGAFLREIDNMIGRPSKVTDGAFSLYSGYGLTEARRRLGADLTQEPVAIADGAEGRVLSLIGSDLARRPNIHHDGLQRALRASADAYETRRPTLALYGVARGLPAQSGHLISAIMSEFDTRRSSQGGDDA